MNEPISVAPLPSLRVAVADDAAALAELMERTFRATFGADNTSAHMAAHCAGSYGEDIQRREILDPSMTTFLHAVGPELRGVAQVRTGRAPTCVTGTAPVEIQRLYVDARWQGKGVAQVLMDASLVEATRRGADVVWLGVWERNPKAIRFYEKFGFFAMGEHVFHLGDDAQRDLILMRAI